MRRTTPVYINQRHRTTYQQLNPTPYYAEYCGHKMHVDQNDKLVRFGVTHVAASDGKWQVARYLALLHCQ